jgi:hypothetical protein
MPIELSESTNRRADLVLEGKFEVTPFQPQVDRMVDADGVELSQTRGVVERPAGVHPPVQGVVAR